MITRLCDFFLSLLGLIMLLPLLVIIFVIGLFDTGSPLFYQRRIGRNEKQFVMVKFRTMRRGTVSVGSHLVDASNVTAYGQVLRKTKLDELPQLWNVLRGDMSLVGPRPCLPSQHELIREREKLGVFDVRPGITGLAQVSGIDMSMPRLLAETDAQMIATMSVKNYFRYSWLTAVGKGFGDRTRSIQ